MCVTSLNTPAQSIQSFFNELKIHSDANPIIAKIIAIAVVALVVKSLISTISFTAKVLVIGIVTFSLLQCIKELGKNGRI